MVNKFGDCTSKSSSLDREVKVYRRVVTTIGKCRLLDDKTVDKFRLEDRFR